MRELDESGFAAGCLVLMVLAALALAARGAEPEAPDQSNAWPDTMELTGEAELMWPEGTMDALPGEEEVARETPAEAELQVGMTEDGTAVAFVDIFRWAGNERVQEANWVLKVPVGLWESTKTAGNHARANPLGWIVAGLAAWEAVDGGVSDLWDDVVGGGSSGRAPAAKASALDPERANVIAEKGSTVEIRDAPQAVFPTIQARDGSTVVVDFQREE
jgi:hypothetical protein